MKRKGAEPATKSDLDRFAAEFNSGMDELKAVVRRQSTHMVKLEAATGNLREDVISAIKGLESRMLGRMDAFMSNTMRVDRDNILLIHRMDTVEGRVSALERRTP